MGFYYRFVAALISVFLLCGPAASARTLPYGDCRFGMNTWSCGAHRSKTEDTTSPDGLSFSALHLVPSGPNPVSEEPPSPPQLSFSNFHLVPSGPNPVSEEPPSPPQLSFSNFHLVPSGPNPVSEEPPSPAQLSFSNFHLVPSGPNPVSEEPPSPPQASFSSVLEASKRVSKNHPPSSIIV